VVAVKASDVDRWMARPDPVRPIMLVFGPDAGLVRERASALVAAAVDDPGDPFQLARIEGDELAGAPTRLIEEASTIPLFGGRRAVWVRAGTRNLAPAVEALIAADPGRDCRVVIEAGDLKRSSPLRFACERAKNAVALPCYADSEQTLKQLIDDEMRANGLSIAPEARAALVPLLGGDRLASRHELGKLALHAGANRRIELGDIIAVVSDASALELNDLIDAAFAGNSKEVEAQFAKARTAATASGTVLAAALRHVGQLHKARLAVEQGTPAEAAAEGFGYVPFARKDAIKRALGAWTSARLERVMGQLADATLEARRQPALAEAIAERALLAVAVVRRKS
jgi:DNA polymerase-3 subunit delta